MKKFLNALEKLQNFLELFKSLWDLRGFLNFKKLWRFNELLIVSKKKSEHEYAFESVISFEALLSFCKLK